MKRESEWVRSASSGMLVSQQNENVSFTHAKMWSDWDSKPINVRLHRLTKCRQLFDCAGRECEGIITIHMSTYTITSNF
jgi:hypothetical protein